MSRSPFQRFVHELRRRHVPQTAAIYLVAAWAAIEFSDVVVPNLNGPQWIVTAVIIAALVGFPVMLVAAWVFEWGPEGIHRTPDAATERMEAPPSYDPETGELETPPARQATARRDDRAQPWLAAVTVLVVGIGSALAVAYVLRGDDGQQAAAPAAEGGAAAAEGAEGDLPGPPEPARPGLEGLGGGFADSIQAEILRAMRQVDSLDLSSWVELGRQVALETEAAILVARPEEWRIGAGPVPVQLAEGDTLTIEGAAFDTTGVVRVDVDGRTVVTLEEGRETARFSAALVGRGSAGTRTVPIVVHTVDGREIRREFQIIQLPGGTP